MLNYSFEELNWPVTWSNVSMTIFNKLAGKLAVDLIVLITAFSASLSFAATIVTNDAQLAAAIDNASGGDVIQLQSGTYVLPEITKKFAQQVTITSLNANAPALISGRFEIRGGKNITIDGLKFKADFPPSAPEYLWFVRVVDESQNIIVRNSDFEGSPDAEGYGIGIAIQVGDGSSDVLIEGNKFNLLNYCSTIGGASGVVFRGNEFSGCSADSMQLVSVTNVLIEGNYFHDSLKSLSSGVHQDMIQVFNYNKTTPSVGITIRDNIFDIGANGRFTQTIFMGNEAVNNGAGEEMYYGDITIVNNVIYNSHSAGISIGESNGLTIRNNTALKVSGNPITYPVNANAVGIAFMPVIKTKSISKNVIIEDNVAFQVTPSGGQSDWQTSGNVEITEESYPQHFSASSLAAGAPHDYVIRKGSAIFNVGSSLMRREEAVLPPYLLLLD